MTITATYTASSRRKPRPPSLITALKQLLQARRDYARLSEMPDHLLRDIGLTRDDVERARRSTRFLF